MITQQKWRIREDNAKYLCNFDSSSAFYGPKSFCMRDTPYPETNQGVAQFSGDNFTRISGDVVGLAETQVFCWDTADR